MIRSVVLDLPAIPSDMYNAGRTPELYGLARGLTIPLKRLQMTGSLRWVIVKTTGDPDLCMDSRAYQVAAYLGSRLSAANHGRKI